jgi:glycerophosphoryl diester phosphodiesterase
VVSWADPPLPIVAAHRGLSSEHPENTQKAFQAAVKAGFNTLELDLRTTSDGEVVILHDLALERTTNGHGRVGEMTYDEMRLYDAGAGPVPRWDDHLARAPRDILWLMETKVRSAVRPGLRLAQHHDVMDRILHMSFQPGQLARSQELSPDLPRAHLFSRPPRAEDLRRAARLGCAWVIGEDTTWTAARLEKVHRAGFRTGAYTVNDPARAVQLLEWGLECFITDRRDVLETIDAVTPVLRRTS